MYVKEIAEMFFVRLFQPTFFFIIQLKFVVETQYDKEKKSVCDLGTFHNLSTFTTEPL